MNIPKLTQKYPAMIHIQRGIENGFRKENTPGFWISGFFIMMLIPLFIKGLEKAMSSSRCFVIVRGATAKSAFWYKWWIVLYFQHSITIFFTIFYSQFQIKIWFFFRKKEHIIKYFLFCFKLYFFSVFWFAQRQWYQSQWYHPLYELPDHARPRSVDLGSVHRVFDGSDGVLEPP